MKILFCNPVTRYLDNARHVPYGILQLMAIIDRDYPQWHQDLYDANAHRADDFQHGKMEGLEEVLAEEDWDVFCVGGIITSYNYIKQALKAVKERKPDCKIVVGGGFFSAIPYDIMRLMLEVDYGVVGEAYKTLPELIRMIERHDDPLVNGMVYREEKNGQLTFTKPRDIIPDLDWLPFPKFEYAPLEIYFKNSSILMSEEAMQARKRIDILGSLGCGFLCRFCWDLGITTTPIYKRADGRVEVKGGRPLPTVMRYHSALYLARLIEHCRKSLFKVGEEYPVDFFAWLDENLQTSITKTKGQWFYELKEHLERMNLIPECIRKGKPHTWACFGPHHGGTGHAGLCNPEYLKLLRSIGFTYLDYGLESWDRRILQWLGKGSTVERNALCIDETLQAGIRPIPNQIIGFPQEDWQSINAMVDAWEQHGIVTVPFIMTPYPGSEIYEKHKKHILDQYNGNLDAFLSDLEDATKITALVCTNFSTVEIAGIQSILGGMAKTQDFRNGRRLLRLAEADWMQRMATVHPVV